jgi:hypothetical protein
MTRILITASFVVAMCAPAAAQRADDDALRHSEAATIAFAAEDYESALDEFRAAYALSPRPRLLYEIGRCADRLGLGAEALDAFEAYLRDVGDDDVSDGAPEPSEVEARVEALRAAIAISTGPTTVPPRATHHALGASAKDPPAASGSPPPPAPSLGPPMEAVAMALIGGALAVAGAITLIAAEVDRGVVERAPSGATWSQISGAATVGPVAEVVGIASMGVGVLGAVVGVAWAASAPGGATRAVVRVAPTGIDLRVTF